MTVPVIVLVIEPTRKLSSVVTGSAPFKVRVPNASTHSSSGDATSATAPGTFSSDMACATLLCSASVGSEDVAGVVVVDPADELSARQAELTKPATTTAPAASQRPERGRRRVARGARP